MAGRRDGLGIDGSIKSEVSWVDLQNKLSPNGITWNDPLMVKLANRMESILSELWKSIFFNIYKDRARNGCVMLTKRGHLG